MNLTGRTALVTGSTSGIGLAIAHELAKAGTDVILNGFGDAQGAQKAVAAHGRRVTYHGADLTRPAEIESMFAAIGETFGQVDILVNNAGIQHVDAIEDFPVEQWNNIIALNLSSVFHCTRLALPGMKKRTFGRVINIASVHGLVGSVGKAAYVAAKHGIIGFTKVAALETARHNVTCNAICPGWVQTPLVRKQIEDRAARKGTGLDEEQQALLLEKQPSGAFVTPEQIGAMAVFLSSEAASEVRGASMVMDGAWTIQ